MFFIRRSKERGHAHHGWLDSHHTFSFADYYDPKHMGFRVLRVINEDRIEGGSGFATHGHRDMEIISYVIEGALEHKDTLGNSTVIWPGEVQRMSAGTGIRHSEYNHIKDKTSHFLQIWILPDQPGREPGYGQKNFLPQLKENGFVLAVSPDGREGSIAMNQNAYVYLGLFASEREQNVKLATGRHAWVQLVRGELSLAGASGPAVSLSAGDGVAISDESLVKLFTKSNAEFIFFDLP